MTVEDQRCVGELRTQSGIARTFSDWKTDGRPKRVSQEDFFRHRLKTYIGQLAVQVQHSLAGTPVLISGMASSSIGMTEVPYAGLPFALDGSQASIRFFESQSDFPHELGLISGVASSNDVMRGEETQLIGAVSLLSWAAQPDKSVFIFPGTHAKHLFVENEQLTHFETFMTGELFGLMAKHSILADSVETADLTSLSEADEAAFRQGVRQSITKPMLAALFTVRTNDLFDRLTKRQNALYLSGLLIGSELGHLLQKTDWPIRLCSSPNLATVYTLAIDELKLTHRTTLVPPDLIDRAAPAGQLQVYQQKREKQPI